MYKASCHLRPGRSRRGMAASSQFCKTFLKSAEPSWHRERDDIIEKASEEAMSGRMQGKSIPKGRDGTGRGGWEESLEGTRSLKIKQYQSR